MNKRILLVDDNRVCLEQTEDFLDLFGYRCILAMNGVDAVKEFKREKPPLILLDVEMPLKNGIEACIEIRNFSRDKVVPAIIGTSASEKYREECLSSGMNDFIPKPWNMDKLVDKFDFYLLNMHDA